MAAMAARLQAQMNARAIGGECFAPGSPGSPGSPGIEEIELVSPKTPDSPVRVRPVKLQAPPRQLRKHPEPATPDSPSSPLEEIAWSVSGPGVAPKTASMGQAVVGGRTMLPTMAHFEDLQNDVEVINLGPGDTSAELDFSKDLRVSIPSLKHLGIARTPRDPETPDMWSPYSPATPHTPDGSVDNSKKKKEKKKSKSDH
jgi:hypothetical protein